MKEYVLKQVDESTEETKARSAFKVGLFLYGYCQGRFGRDSHEDKKILKVGDNSITVMENGVVSTSLPITSWIELLDSSNNELESRNTKGD